MSASQQLPCEPTANIAAASEAAAAALLHPARRLRTTGSSCLLQRIGSNDATLRCLRLDPQLIAFPNTKDALLHNTNIRSIVFVKVTPKIVSEVAFATLLDCLYHLPLRSLQAGGGLHLPAAYMEHVLHLAEYCCGVGKGCKWSRSECKGEDAYKLNAADSAMTAASPAVVEEGAAAAAEKDAEMSAPSDDRKAAAELEFLDLSGSCLTESQALWLGTIIFHPRCSLRRVDLCECGLGNAGLRALLREAASSPRLGDAVVGVTPLDVLALRWNGVTEDESFGGILNRLDESTCNMYLEVHGNYLSSSVQRRLADREAKMMPIVVAQRRARRAEAKVVQNAQEHRKQEQQQKPEQLEPSSSCYALGLLLSIDENPPSSLPSLHLLASLLYARE